MGERLEVLFDFGSAALAQRFCGMSVAASEWS
jgi:hypothetical protein